VKDEMTGSSPELLLLMDLALAKLLKVLALE
jgi:hypothetical protein